MIRLNDINKAYKNGELSNEVLHDVTLEIPDAKVVSITGPSGAGKSTLLNLMALLDVPTSGSIYFNDQLVSEENAETRAAFRLKRFGFVFQDYQLISTMNARDNIVFPAHYKGDTFEELYFQQIVSACQLNNLLEHFPHELSGGEQQRVAVCRALCSKPDVIFADEPTVNLDSKNAETVFNLLIESVRLNQGTLIYVTHEARFAELADMRILVNDGVCQWQT